MHWIARLLWTALIGVVLMTVVFLGAPTVKAFYVGATTQDSDAAGKAAADLGSHLGEHYGPWIAWGSLLAGLGLACTGRLPGTRRKVATA